MATKKKNTLVVGAQQPKDDYKPSQAEIDEANRKVLFMLAERLRKYAEQEDMSKLKIKYGESKPLKPVYVDGNSKAVRVNRRQGERNHVHEEDGRAVDLHGNHDETIRKQEQ